MCWMIVRGGVGGVERLNELKGEFCGDKRKPCRDLQRDL